MVKAVELITPEIYQLLFQQSDQRQKAAGDLKALQAQPGWILIERIFKFHMDQMAQKILDDEEVTADEEKDLKRERAFFNLFRSIPDAWTTELMQAEVTAREENDDPFA